jgi:RecB family exonuclease
VEFNYCFESDETANLYADLYPERAEHLFSWERLVFQLEPDQRLPKHRRIELISAQLPDGLKADAAGYLKTIEVLREGLVSTHEDVDFAFSLLAETPKNQILKGLLHKYLDSPLALDWPQHALRLIDRAKPSDLRLQFVRDLSTSPLFTETARAFSAPVVEAGEMAWREERACLRPLPLFWGTSPVVLDRLAAHAAHQLNREGDKDNLLIAFHGEPSELLFLECALSHSQVPYRSLILHDSKLSSEIPRVQIQNRLREDRSRPLADRLRYANLLWDPMRAHPDEQPLAPAIERLVALEQLSAEEGRYLCGLVLKDPRPKPSQAPAVRVIPLCPLPPDPWQVLTYLGRGWTEPAEKIPFLREEEARLLGEHGFAVRRWDPSRLAKALQQKTRGTRRLFAISAETRTILKGKWALLKPKQNPSSSARDSFQLTLPARALSASQLEAYARCPAQFLFSNRLALRKRSPTSDERFFQLFGQAVHLALEMYFKERPQEVEAEGLKNAFAQALKELAPLWEKDDPFTTMLQENFRPMAERIPGMEKDLAERLGKSQPIALEDDFAIQIDGLWLKGVIDRIQKTEEGKLLVLDYKTGSVDFSPDHIAQGSHFQTLLYCLAAEARKDGTLSGMLFYDLKHGELRRGVLIDERITREAKKRATRGHTLSEIDYEKLKQTGLSGLKQLAARLGTGDFAPTPAAGPCSVCDYAALCRQGVDFE